MTALIWTVFESKEEAKNVVSILLQEHLIACANINDTIHSMFVWKGNVEEQKECGVLLKTNSPLLKSAISRLEQLHPYETPAILGWHCDEAGTATKRWLAALDEDGGHESTCKT